MDGVHGRVLRITVHPLRHLRLLGVETAAMLIVGLWRRYRSRRVGLRSVIDGRIGTLHLGGGSHEVGCFSKGVSKGEEQRSGN
jgi:hypothetical protein